MLSKKYQDFASLIFYQVYPRSFSDSNHDGIGDLPGLIQKLDYLHDLGVNAVWLSPCFKSPNDDGGYDISDYCDIMDEFGTLEDMKTLITEMHRRGMKLILDLVANHSSTAHPWFQQSRKSKDNPYSDFYYWFDNPPNDWNACFGGSAWQYDEPRKQYYLHSYAVSQADLNWENTKVRDAMKAVVDFWVALGVDGFRCDVLDQISKDFPKNKNGNGPRLHEFIHELFGRKSCDPIFTVGECWSADEGNIRELTQSHRHELSTVFQFQHLSIGTKDDFRITSVHLDDLKDILIKWQTFSLQNDTLYTLFYENHDQLRYISKFGNDSDQRYESATMFATLFYLLKGIPFIYQGQEIGVTNSYSKSIDDIRDIQAINYYHENPNHMSPKLLLEAANFRNRDNARRPMPWDASPYAGFSTVEPWIPTYPRYREINVETDRHSPRSIFRYYQKLLKLRKDHSEVTLGDFKAITEAPKGCFVYRRDLEERHLLVVINFDQHTVLHLDGLEPKTLLLSNCSHEKRDLNGAYRPYEVAVFAL